jgi:acetolactate synthase-1/2/3 large subunit
MGSVIAHLGEVLPEDAIITNGAGNYAVWVHRFHQYRRFRTQLAPTSGSMGYGTPAAIAGKLKHPDRDVICVAGDGCFLMTAQELATAAREELAIVWLVVNNGIYGTIRMHQERHHPGHVMATNLTNPDFVAYAAAFGIPGECVERTEDFPEALTRARGSDRGYLIELKTDPEAITPVTTLSRLRSSSG